ncbi:DUF6316 family protein [Hahella sp. NBU794]|uniref:DUF6316 family protein n=1 Tax=Hahella sp. NBU794 TaxID=3422590 RepID=UPI003D6DC76E
MPNTNRRNGDRAPFDHIRSEMRLYQVDGQWYCKTRENISLGPYETTNAAEKGLAAYLQYFQSASI